jgi:hypothetical protein
MKRILINNLKHLQEKLIPADNESLKLLKQNMKNDPELTKRLTEPAMNNKYYKYLIREIAFAYRKKSLFYIIERTIKDKNMGFIPYFCQIGNNITAFFAYMEDGDVIEDIKVFSLLDQNQLNPVLAKDLIKFLDENLKTHSIIMWRALKENPAVIQYNKVVKMFGLNITEGNKEIEDPESSYEYLYVLKKEM